MRFVLHLSGGGVWCGGAFRTEQADVNLLKCVHTAELVQLMVHFVEDQSLVIVHCVVPYNGIHCSGKREER